MKTELDVDTVAAKQGPDPRSNAYVSEVSPPGWRPEPQSGITLHDPAVEVSAREYDTLAKALIADHAGNVDEQQKVRHSQARGWVLRRNGNGVFLRGRG